MRWWYPHLIVLGHRYNGAVKRRLFTILSALSVLLFVAVCALWVRSYGDSDHWVWRRIDTKGGRIRELYVHSWRGRFRVSDLVTPFSDDLRSSPFHMAQLEGTGG